MIRSFFYKLLIMVFTFMIILSAVYFMCGGRNAAANITLQDLAGKNSVNISDEVTLPKITAKADPSVMRTESGELTREDLSSIYIGGKRYDFPCTLAELNEDYDVFAATRGYDEELGTYTGTALIYSNGILILIAGFHCSDEDIPLDKCVTTRLAVSLAEHNEEYTPQIVFAGMDIHNTSKEEMYYLMGLSGEEYLMNSNIYFPVDGRYKGYVSVNTEENHNIIFQRITYNPDYDEKKIDSLKRNGFVMLANEIRLPEDYSPEKYPGIPPEEYPEIIFDEENITPKIKEYGMTAYELMAQAGIESLDIYTHQAVEDNPEYRVVQCNYKHVYLLLKDGQQLGESAVFYADEYIMKSIDR